jgi:hypothetical protein
MDNEMKELLVALASDRHLSPTVRTKAKAVLHADAKSEKKAPVSSTPARATLETTGSAPAVENKPKT